MSADVPVRMRPGIGTWLRTATANERMFCAEVSILACNASGPDLVKLAISLDMEAHWGEREDGLRARILWRARYYSRVRAVESQPPILLRWWAHLINAMPERRRPALRRLVDWWRGPEH